MRNPVRKPKLSVNQFAALLNIAGYAGYYGPLSLETMRELNGLFQLGLITGRSRIRGKHTYFTLTQTGVYRLHATIEYLPSYYVTHGDLIEAYRDLLESFNP